MKTAREKIYYNKLKIISLFIKKAQAQIQSAKKKTTLRWSMILKGRLCSDKLSLYFDNWLNYYLK